jgi:alkanesulfonate monooxygenase SsuD/methylene tetrahydromethanopterin reductase-like flavin-dependent oxidoreductase (luciferase family)
MSRCSLPITRTFRRAGSVSIRRAASCHMPTATLWSWPKPAQRPHPPVLVGGNGPTVLDRVLAFGDAWFPGYEPGLLERVVELRGRADRTIDVVAIGVPADPAALEPLADAAFRRVVHWIPAGSRSIVERAIDQWETAIAQLNGEA